MRVAAIADVHGNAPALEAVAAGMPAFERIEQTMRTPPSQAEVIEHAERVVFAG